MSLIGRILGAKGLTSASTWPSTGAVLASGSGVVAPDVWDTPMTYLVPHTGDDLQLTGIHKAYADLYASQPWLYTVITRLARDLGRMPLKCYGRAAGSADRSRLRDEPLPTLLGSPAPRLTPGQFKQQIVTDVCIYGNALALKVAAREGDVPDSLQPLPPIGWRVAGGGEYVWRDPRSGAEKAFDPWRIMHFANAGPRTASGMALSPMEPLRVTLAIEDAAQRLGVATFTNGARPSGTLTTDKEISKETLARLREDIVRLHSGPDKSMRPAILTNGLKWNTMAWDFTQAAVIEFRKLTREEVCGVYHVSPVLVGILDRATFSNVEELHLAHYQDSLGPWANLIEETIGAQLIDGVPAFAGNFVEFDFNEFLKGAISARFTAYNQAIQAGWLTPNEVRDRENLGRITAQAEADEIHVSLALGGSQTGAGRSGTGTPEPPPSALPNDTPTGEGGD